jgi:hypothetical protein
MGIEFISPNIQIEEFMRETGGSKNMTVDGSGTPVIFEWKAIELSYITRLSILVQDVLVSDSTKFGQLGALANGVLIRQEDASGAVLFRANDGEAIKTNGDWGRMAKTAISSPFAKQLCIHYSPQGHPFYVEEGGKLIVEIQDDLTAMLDMTVQVGGFKYR